MVNAQDNEGRPPLHCVMNSKTKGGVKCIKILLNSGADINMVDNIGMSALHLAAHNNRPSRINFLVSLIRVNYHWDNDHCTMAGVWFN